MVEAAGTSETSVSFYQTARRSIPGDGIETHLRSIWVSYEVILYTTVKEHWILVGDFIVDLRTKFDGNPSSSYVDKAYEVLSR
jgi:hypothetical protein